MMSISPPSGQGAVAPSVQIAGQLPLPHGSLARTSIRP
jgi:hypothetical protein